MLSHHELATLLRLKDSASRLESIDPEVLALSRYELVEIDTREEGNHAHGSQPKGNQRQGGKRQGSVSGSTSTLRLTSRGRDLVRRLSGESEGD